MARALRAGLIPARAGKTRRRPGRPPLRRAHPRACGENELFSVSPEDTPGSSPRVRGKLSLSADSVKVEGLIPARAGKTASHGPRTRPHEAHPRACGENVVARSKSSGRGAHPRACGENANTAPHALALEGSSPRVRGKRGAATRGRRPRGLIPARAGKTSHSGVNTFSPWAHPRACGENGGAAEEITAEAGSSPRVRGKPCRVFPVSRSDGLIPARAGKTFYHGCAPPPGAAHPRACGENPEVRAAPRRGQGSSPRVRGKRGVRVARRGCGRLIPARAGKTSIAALMPVSVTAHPRACGENLARLASPSPWPGSSPRVRGKPGKPLRSSAGLRLIPARAGKTRVVDDGIAMVPAHPRACGENNGA